MANRNRPKEDVFEAEVLDSSVIDEGIGISGNS